MRIVRDPRLAKKINDMIGLIEGQGDIGKQLREIKASIEALKVLFGKVRGSGSFDTEPDTAQTIIVDPQITNKCRVTLAPHNSWSADAMNTIWVQDISNGVLTIGHVRNEESLRFNYIFTE